MAVDVISDGSLVVPVCGPVPTSGLTVVKLRLSEPRVAQVGARGRTGMGGEGEWGKTGWRGQGRVGNLLDAPLDENVLFGHQREISKGWFTRTTQAQAQATCEPGRRKHKKKQRLR